MAISSGDATNKNPKQGKFTESKNQPTKPQSLKPKNVKKPKR